MGSEAEENSHPEVIDEVELDESCLDLNETSKTHNVRHISTMPRQRTQKGLGGVKGRKLSQPNSNGKTQSESKKSLNLSSSNNNEKMIFKSIANHCPQFVKAPPQ